MTQFRNFFALIILWHGNSAAESLTLQMSVIAVLTRNSRESSVFFLPAADHQKELMHLDRKKRSLHYDLPSNQRNCSIPRMVWSIKIKFDFGPSWWAHFPGKLCKELGIMEIDALPRCRWSLPLHAAVVGRMVVVLSLEPSATGQLLVLDGGCCFRGPLNFPFNRIIQEYCAIYGYLGDNWVS